MSKETKALKDLKRAYDKALEQTREHEFREYLNLQRLDKAEKKIEELEKENKKLKEIAEEHKNCTRKHWQQKCAEHCANEMIYKSRIDKAIEYIKWNLDANQEIVEYFNYDGNFNKVLDILQGSDDNER